MKTLRPRRSWTRLIVGLATFAILGLLPPAPALALPKGYLVWSKGSADDPATRRIFRTTLPDRSDERALTSGEDIEPQVSPDGKWIAYAKAKFSGGSDYHDFRLWRIYIVSIHGTGNGRREIKIDDDGAWPSWGKSGALIYNQADGTHSRIMRVELDSRGKVSRRDIVLVTKDAFGGYAELNEVSAAPDESWFAARTRGNTIQNGVTAITVSPRSSALLARAGSIGCMPRVAPSSSFAIIAGATEGIRWGHGPKVAVRKEDQLLIAPLSPAHKAYHPGFASDERWVLAAQGTDLDHNGGRYDLYIHAFDPATMVAGAAEPLAMGGFNGWPDIWVGEPSAAPPARPEVTEFFPSSYTVTTGEPITLNWTTFGADDVLLAGKPVAPEGKQEQQPTATTAYVLIARSATGIESDTRTVSVTVNASALPVAIVRFSAEPAQIEKGRSVTLSWEVGNATTLEVAGQRAAPIETREISPLETTTYTLLANGHTGSVQASVTVVVSAQKNGLLPDRGGFNCATAPGGQKPLSPGVAAWLILGLFCGLGFRLARRRP